MNIHKKTFKKMCSVLACTTMLSSFVAVNAANTIVTESPMDEPINEEANWTTDEEKFEEIEVTYTQAFSYNVTIPKTITLDRSKQAVYSVRVTGDIDANQRVYVAPVDGITDTEDLDFYMKDQTSNSRKADVVATVEQNKFYWDSEEVADGYEETNNNVTAPGLTAGTWKGTFQMEIRLESNTNESEHTHSYTENITKEATCTETGTKILTCECGDTREETIPMTAHNYVDGICTECGGEDSGYHRHDYIETMTKAPTCTETGEKALTCSCGDTKTESIPATGHSYGDNDKCTSCGTLNPDHQHNYVDGICTGCGIHENHTFVGGVCSCGEKDMSYVPEIQILATQKRSTGQWYNVSALSDLETIMNGLEENGVIEVTWDTSRSYASADFKTKNVYVGVLARLADTWAHVYHKNAATVTLNGKPLAFTVNSGSTASGEYVNDSNYGYYRYDITLPDSTSGSETFEMVTTAANGNAVKLNGTVSWPKNANTITIKVTACEVIYAEE